MTIFEKYLKIWNGKIWPQILAFAKDTGLEASFSVKAEEMILLDFYLEGEQGREEYIPSLDKTIQAVMLSDKIRSELLRFVKQSSCPGIHFGFPDFEGVPYRYSFEVELREIVKE